jgi:hypothetical protein
MNLVAEVRPMPGIGTWLVCAWLGTERLDYSEGGQFALLTDAHREADALTAALFGHRCDAECGPWVPVKPRPGPSDGERLMTGRITRLIDDQQAGTIAGEDGTDYTFQGSSLLGMTFGALGLGTAVTFVATAATKRAAVVRLVTK